MMQSSRKTPVSRDLERLFRRGTAPAGDGALLREFLGGGEEAAFEALVSRHGPMVLGVCRRVLGSPHDADDAFQATFLVLVRKAGHLRDPDRLGPWLHGVATRVATKARTRAARRRPEPLHDVPARDQPASEWADVRPILDAELGRLSTKYRDVLVLCLLEGASAEEAAARLACPVGTVKSRLARGREALRTRLVGRGIAPSVPLGVVASGFAPPVSAALTRATLATIASAPAAMAPAVVALTRGAVPSMLPKSTWMASLMIGGLALGGLGLSPWMRSAAVAQQEPRDGAPAPSATDESRDHIKQILLAFHNYADANGHLPPAAIYGADGQPKLSWRVALLPYLDGNDLYTQFRQDEPWDSPHNRALARRMPAVFRTPHSPASADDRTRIRSFAGKGTMFEGVQGLEYKDVTDGLSNTLLIAVAKDDTLWTQPGELPFIPGQPLRKLDASHANGYLVGLGDGAFHVIPKGDDAFLRSLITRAGNEVIDWNRGARGATAPAAGGPPALTPPPTKEFSGMFAAMGGMGAGGASAPDTIEQRLRRVEEKLDLVLQKLDARAGGPSAEGVAQPK